MLLCQTKQFSNFHSLYSSVSILVKAIPMLFCISFIASFCNSKQIGENIFRKRLIFASKETSYHFNFSFLPTFGFIQFEMQKKLKVFRCLPHITTNLKLDLYLFDK